MRQERQKVRHSVDTRETWRQNPQEGAIRACDMWSANGCHDVRTLIDWPRSVMWISFVKRGAHCMMQYFSTAESITTADCSGDSGISRDICIVYCIAWKRDMSESLNCGDMMKNDVQRRVHGCQELRVNIGLLRERERISEATVKLEKCLQTKRQPTFLLANNVTTDLYNFN